MVSIIICSTHHILDEELRDNIKATIGNDVEYEIIGIDNSDNHHSIFSAYAEGVRLSKGDYLCFMHQDIIFHTNEWGNKIEKAFSNEQVGMLGIIGSTVFTSTMVSWGYSPIIAHKGKIIQGHTYGNGIYKTFVEKYENQTSDNFVVAVDGLWMCIRKSLFLKGEVSFDEKMFNGFHFYDIDTCFQVIHKGYKIEIVNIDIEHKSHGNMNDAFWEARKKLQKKWKDFMPFCCDEKNKDTLIEEADMVVIEKMRKAYKKEKQLMKIINMPLHKLATKIYLMRGKQL